MAGWTHGTAPPDCHEVPAQVSLPYSPGPGQLQNVHTIAPVAASSA